MRLNASCRGPKATSSRPSPRRPVRSARFVKVYDEYRKAPEVTRKRIFLETMERVFGGTDKIILDSKGGSGVVPYLPLNELTKKPGQGGN